MDALKQQRIEAFCDGRIAPGAFHSVEHGSDVFRPDPLDVPEIHQEVREHFGRMVESALAGDTAHAGSILVLKGEAGAGKTHLMRAFRDLVHRRERGFFAYMQMTTSASSYPRYILNKVIDSFDEPYALPLEREPGLRILSNAVVAQLPASRVEALRSAESSDGVRKVVHELADRLLDRLLVPQLDLDLVRALLLLQVDRPSVRARVTKYLRHEPVSTYDLEALGGLSPRDADADPLHDLAQIAAVLRRVLDRSLVVCIDQLEDIYNLEDARKRFPSAMDAVKQVAEIPGSIVVVSCLDGFYQNMKGALANSIVQRLELAPSPMLLKASRSAEDVRRLLGARLRFIFESAEPSITEPSDVFPFPDTFVRKLDGKPTRDVLSLCHAFRMRAIELGEIPAIAVDAETDGKSLPPPPGLTQLRQAWNDEGTKGDVPDDEDDLIALLQSTIRSCGAQLADHTAFETIAAEAPLQFMVRHVGFEGSHKNLLVGLCDRGAQNNGLRTQLEELERRQRGQSLVVVRSGDYPSNPKTKIVQFIGKLIAAGARRVKVEDADWRRMASFPVFEAKYRADPSFDEFLRTDRPLLSIQAVREIVAAEGLRPATVHAAKDRNPGSGNAEGATAAEGPAPARPLVDRSTSIPLGRTLGGMAREVSIEVEALKRHSAFLGGTGSGKTTAALNVVEELLLRGIPALLVDRKGDLAGYAIDEVWNTPAETPERDAQRAELRARVQVDLYTPGNPDGRSFSIRLLPADFGELSLHEQQQAARVTAMALAAMMQVRGQKLDRATAVLQSALVHAAQSRGSGDFDLDTFLRHLSDPEPSLFASLGSLKDFLAEVVLALDIMLRNRGSSLQGDEPLDVARMLAPSAGRTRLAIVSTKFVGVAADVQFWVSRLVSDFIRMGQRRPSDRLQAVLLLDEADAYLPATAQPASKQPVEDLLRRGRSAGLGVMLATQSPGDLDYRCRDNVTSWFIGRVGQKTALAKLEPLFEGRNGSIQALPQQDIGQFHYVGERSLERLQFTRNLVRLPAQVPDADILTLAARGRLAGKIHTTAK